MANPSVLVVDACPALRKRISDTLASLGCEHSGVEPQQAEGAVARHRPDIVIMTAGTLDPTATVDRLRTLHARFAQVSYMFIAAISSEDLAIAALQAGARRYLKEPWTQVMLESAIKALLPRDSVGTRTSDSLVDGDRLIGRSAAIRQLRGQVARVASANSNVLVLGETGTGKELVAELLHLNSPRSARPFICINTAAIPDTLLENELFGHERGAFTGATGTQSGKLAAAHQGTVFLDEIGDVSLATQAKLLRAIENKAVYRLGGTRTLHLDVRIIAATNSDLEHAIEQGHFRKDLYYRLNVVRVELPPLRDRVEDIPLLIGHYLLTLNRQIGRSVQGLSARAMDTLCEYHWPGNVRELRNVVEALLVNLAPETTGIVDVPPEVMRQLTRAMGAPRSERERLLHALTATNWNKTKAAGQLRMSRMTLYRKMHQYGVAARP